jgi:hypothetical protein
MISSNKARAKCAYLWSYGGGRHRYVSHFSTPPGRSSLYVGILYEEFAAAQWVCEDRVGYGHPVNEVTGLFGAISP